MYSLAHIQGWIICHEPWAVSLQISHSVDLQQDPEFASGPKAVQYLISMRMRDIASLTLSMGPQRSIRNYHLDLFDEDCKQSASIERRLQSYTKEQVDEVGRVLFRHPRSVLHQA
jgi:hypothetical protein